MGSFTQNLPGSILGQGIKIVHATWCDQKKLFKKLMDKQSHFCISKGTEGRAQQRYSYTHVNNSTTQNKEMEATQRSTNRY